MFRGTDDPLARADTLENHSTDLDLPVFNDSTNPAIIVQPLSGSDPNLNSSRRPIPVSTIDWQTTNVSQFIPMHGLDFLGGADHLQIQQTVELNDLLSNVNSENRYMVKVPNGETLFYASETSTSFQRMCFGTSRAFEIMLYDQTQQPVMEIRRRLACGTCPFWCYLQTMDVWVNPSQMIGSVEQQFSASMPLFFVYNQYRDLLYRIEGPQMCGCISFGKDAYFKIYTGDGMTQVGGINHQWDQLLVGYNLSIQYPNRSIDTKHKAVLLAAGFLLEYMYFESSRYKSCKCSC